MALKGTTGWPSWVDKLDMDKKTFLPQKTAREKTAAKAPADMSSRPGWLQVKYLPVVCLVVWCVAGVMLRSGPSATVLTSDSARSDFLTPISGAWALESGMHIHTDFSTPLGLAYYLPYYWMLKIFGNTDALVRHTESAIFVIFSVLSFLLLRPPRYSWKITAMGVVLISLLASNPIALGDPPTSIDEGLAYNYICIAWGYLCLLIALFPPTGEPAAIRRRETFDALLLAAGLVWVAFTKITFVGQNFIFLLAALALYRLTQGRWRLRFIGIVALGFLLMSAAFVIVYHIDLGAMFHDIRMAGNSRSHYILVMDNDFDNAYRGVLTLYLIAQKAIVANQAELVLLAVALLCGLTSVIILGRAPLWRLAAYGSLMVLVLFFDVSQNVFNAYGNSLPMLAFMWLFLMCVLERGQCIQASIDTAAPARQAGRCMTSVAAVAVGCHIAFVAAGHVSAFCYNTGLWDWAGDETSGAVYNRMEGIQTKSWNNLIFALPRHWEGRWPPYDTVINEGLALLRDNGCDKRRVFNLDQVNPFPFLLGTPYPVGQPCWLHAQATFNLWNHFPPETLFQGADVIMIPQKQVINPATQTLLLQLYAHYLNAHYSFVAKNDYWVLLQRR
jgi:hypothetical protein